MKSAIAFFRQPRNLPILIIPLLLLIWGQFVAPALGEASFTNVALFDSPYRAALPLGSGGDAVADNVVVIVIDGLRLDVSQQLPTLNQLRAQGADRALVVGQPSFSLPGWTVIGTGAWQEQSGVTTNYYQDSIAVDTLFEEAKRAGLTTAIVGDKPWGQLYDSGVDTEHLMDELPDEYTNLEADLQFDRDTTDLALQVLQTQPNLMLIHLLSVDSTGHGWGGASPEYLQAAQNADNQVARIVDALDLSNTALFITADHGHLDRGGHGGWESIVLHVPLVAAGQGIKPGQYSQAEQSAIAPTLATLLGTAIPAHNQGSILFDELAMSDSLKASRAVDLATQITQRYDSMLETIGDSRRVDDQALTAAQSALTNGNSAEALTQTQHVLDSAYAQWDAARADRLNRERLGRVPVILLVLVIAALYLWWWRREGWNWRAPFIGAVIYFVLWNLNYFVIHRFTYSISMFNQEALVVPFITGRVMEALIALVIAVVVVSLLRRRAERGEIARDVVHTMLLIALVLGVQILIFYGLWDFLPTWYLPALGAGFKFYLDLYQTTAFWPILALPAAALLPLIALLIAGIANRLLPNREHTHA